MRKNILAVNNNTVLSKSDVIVVLLYLFLIVFSICHLLTAFKVKNVTIYYLKLIRVFIRESLIMYKSGPWFILWLPWLQITLSSYFSKEQKEAVYTAKLFLNFFCVTTASLKQTIIFVRLENYLGDLLSYEALRHTLQVIIPIIGYSINNIE